MQRFEQQLAVQDHDRVLDVGGSPFNWQFVTHQPHVLLLNLTLSGEPLPEERFTETVGDARALVYGDQAFDVSFSNSVIEHVGSLEDQRRFASEVRRVGRRVWVQTPARGFPLEPHFLTLFVHWLPRRLRPWWIRWFSLWSWLTRPSTEAITAMLAEIRLLSRAEMQELFPDCEILVERVLFMPKSYIAVRR